MTRRLIASYHIRLSLDFRINDVLGIGKPFVVASEFSTLVIRPAFPVLHFDDQDNPIDY